MATFEYRKDRDGSTSSIRVKVRRKGFPPSTKNFEVTGPRQADLNRAKREAEAWARMVESEMDRGVFVSRSESEQTTLDECLERYSVEITPHKKGAEAEMSKIRILRAHAISQRFMAQIRSADIAAYRDERLKVVKSATVHRELALLSNLFSIARKEWGMENLANPVQLVRKPKLPNGRDRRLLTGELEAIVAESESAELGAIILLAVETAMRRSELLGLDWKLINLKNRYLKLPDTKNGEGRTVPLSTTAVKLLEKLPRRISGRVFTMRGDSVTQAFTRARERARKNYLDSCHAQGERPVADFLENLTFHDLRHEATSRFFEKGLNPIEAASVTGHKDLRMLKRYTHLKAEELAKKLG